ncbi:MAG: tetratricopeptide repeat protein [Elusimicrobia bacterium]|nr:tetratricopeptide repeat protein [Elusimicrobiota bacterium]
MLRSLKASATLLYLVLLAAGLEALTAWSGLDRFLLAPLLYYQAALPDLHRSCGDARLFEMRPSAQASERGLTYRTNRLGLRDPERPTPKPPATLRIVVLGGSTTFGAGVEAAEAFPARLEQVLQGPGRIRAEVWNAGLCGYVLSQEVALARKLLAEHEPDLLIFQHLNAGRRPFLPGQDPRQHFAREPSLYPENLPFLPFGDRGLGLIRRSSFIRAWVAALNRPGWARKNNDAFSDENANLETFRRFAETSPVPVVLVPLLRDHGPGFPFTGAAQARLFRRENLPDVPYAEYFLAHPPACVHDWYGRTMAAELAKLGLAPARLSGLDRRRDTCSREPPMGVASPWLASPGALREPLAILEQLSREHPRDAGVWLARADANRRAGDHGLAMSSIQRALELRPQDPEVLGQAAMICSGRAECGPALRQGLRLAKASPADPEAWVLLAELSLRSGDPSTSRRSLARARGLGPGPLLKVRMALCLETLDEAGAGLELWAAALPGLTDVSLTLACAEHARAGQRPMTALACLRRGQELALLQGGLVLDQAWLALAESLQPEDSAHEPRRTGRPCGQACAACERLDTLRPDDPAVQLACAEVAARAGAVAAAAGRLSRADSPGLRPQERRRLAACYRDIGEPARALAAFRKLLAGDAPPASADLLAAAEAAVSAEERDEALRLLGAAEKAGLSLDETRRAAGLYGTLGASAASLRLLDKLSAQEPQTPSSLVERAASSAAAGRRSQALSRLEAALALGTTAEELRRAAAAFRNMGERNRALDLYAELVRREPGKAAAHIDLAQASADAGRREAALASLARGRGLRPTAEERRLIALAYLSLGSPADCLSLLRTVPTSGQDAADRWSDLGVCALQAGSRNEAEAAFRSSLRLDPGHLPAAAGLGSMLAGSGRAKEALAVYDRALSRPAPRRWSGLRQDMEEHASSMRSH